MILTFGFEGDSWLTESRRNQQLGNAEREAVSRLYAAHEKLSPPDVDTYEPGRQRSALGELSSGSNFFFCTQAEVVAFVSGLILREPYINDTTTDTAWTNAVVFSMILDILPLIQHGSVQLSEWMSLDGFLNRVYAEINCQTSVSNKSCSSTTITRRWSTASNSGRPSKRSLESM
jgi:hypothetical protein